MLTPVERLAHLRLLKLDATGWLTARGLCGLGHTRAACEQQKEMAWPEPPKGQTSQISPRQHTGVHPVPSTHTSWVAAELWDTSQDARWDDILWT